MSSDMRSVTGPKMLKLNYALKTLECSKIVLRAWAFILPIRECSHEDYTSILKRLPNVATIKSLS